MHADNSVWFYLWALDVEIFQLASGMYTHKLMHENA